jgi:hypothetical protein
MFLRYTIVALGLAVANTAGAQLQQPKSLQGHKSARPVAQTATQSSAPVPQHSLAVLRETDAKSAPRSLTPIVFQDAEALGPISAPSFAEAVPQPEAEKGYCSSCNCHGGACGCGRGIRGRIRQHHMYYFGYDPEAWVRPFGAATLDHLEKQVANGVAARMTLYSYDFAMGGKDQAKLNPAGWQQLTKIANLAGRSDFPIVIESTGNKVDEQLKRQAVLDALRAMGSDIAIDRVVVARPTARGLSGEEAIIVYNNLIQQTQSRGNVVSDQFTSDNGDSGSSEGGSESSN